MAPNPCGVIVTRDRGGRVYFEPCGAPARYVIKIGGDNLFAACHRHNARLARAGVREADPPHSTSCPFRGDQRLAVPA